jgi:hypothetical protein
LITSLPLIASSPMLSRPTLGLHAVDGGDQRAAHHGELQQVLGVQSTLAPRSSTVVKPSSRLGITDGDGRPVDALQRLEHVARHRHQRAGVAGRDAGVRCRGSPAAGLSCATRMMATRIDHFESRFLRSATSTGSSIVHGHLGPAGWRS